MSLQPGARLGPYEIVSALGAGGMGEVFRARDSRLNRDVAIKVLPDLFASDADRLARFTREAQTLASLNHPNIAIIYGLEQAGDVHALVMELVPGEDLSQRIARGAIPIDEALPIAKQIAEALEAAHEQGIIHRDLKPANIKLRQDGTVKVLDFGLAKALEPPSIASDLSQSPTITSPAMMTGVGVLLGTAAYMAPEQARGRAVDKRADIWAFGCVLFEMLTGRHAIEGDTVTDILVAVMTKEPGWNGLPAATPPRIVELLRRCLKRDPRERLRDIGDARIVLEDSSELPQEAPSAARPRRDVVRAALPWALTLAMSVAVLTFIWQEMTQQVAFSDEPPAHFEIELPDLFSFGTNIAIAPDGRQIIYVSSRADGHPVLYRRSLRDTVVQELAGTEGAAFPFFSPDGEWVGFHADGELRRVPITGGRPTVICQTPEAMGASWSTDGYIVFGTPGGGLFRVPAAGGRPTRLTTPTAEGDAHTFPQVLSDQQTVLFTIVPINGSPKIGVLSLDTAAEWSSLIDGFNARYSPTGHLLFARPGLLLGVPFDTRTRRVGGEPTVLVEQLFTGILGWATYDVSTHGQLVYVTTQDQLSTSTLVWVNREGKIQPVLDQQAAGYLQPAVSAKGDRLAVSADQAGEIVRIWTYDLADGRLAPVVLDSRLRLSAWPVWSPDGNWIAFVSDRAQGFNVFRARADGSGHVEQLTFDPVLRTVATSWSVDGVLALEQGPIGRRDIMVLSTREGSKPEPLIATEFHERGGKFSPDGRWLAFTSDRSGRDEVWVKAYPGDDPPMLVSIGGGKEPVWSRDGRELFYRNRNRMLSVPIATGPMLRAGKPRVLFEGQYSYGYFDWALNYDVAPDGRFVMVKEGPVPKLQVIVNWFEELKRLAPTKR